MGKGLTRFKYEKSSWLAYVRACDFLAVASELDNQEDLKLSPLVVNAAFACELFLKALLIWKYKKKISGHKLKELFQQLDDETKIEIQQEVDILDWDFFLDEANQAFIKWRYLHEKDEAVRISVSELTGFAEGLKKIYARKVLDKTKKLL